MDQLRDSVFLCHNTETIPLTIMLSWFIFTTCKCLLLLPFDFFRVRQSLPIFKCHEPNDHRILITVSPGLAKAYRCWMQQLVQQIRTGRTVGAQDTVFVYTILAGRDKHTKAATFPYQYLMY